MSALRIFASLLFVAFAGFMNVLAAQPAIDVFTPGERGKILNNSRTGEWTYFDVPGKASLKVDYTKGELTYFEPDTAKFVVWKDNRWIREKLSIPCRFHGSIMTLQDHYLKAVGIPTEVMQTKKDVDGILSFEVDERGVAVNPEVVEHAGFPKFKQEMLQAFNQAPNFWIVGIDNQGNAVRCKMAIRFRFCATGCPEKPMRGVNARQYMDFVTTGITSRVSFGMADESRGIQFSPDDSKVMMEVGDLLAGKILAIANISDAKNTAAPFPDVNGALWLDNQHVLFKYKHGTRIHMPAVFNVDTNEIISWVDSSMYFSTLAEKSRVIAFARLKENGIAVWKNSLESHKSEQILNGIKKPTYPVAWSPDEKSILFVERAHGFSKFFLLNCDSMKRTTLPVFNTALAGWGDDGSIFLLKTKLTDYSYAGALFKVDPAKGSATPIFQRKQILHAQYHPRADKFVLLIGDDAFLFDPKKSTEPELLVRDVSQARWSNNGKMIAYIKTKDKQLYVIELESRASKKISNWKY